MDIIKGKLQVAARVVIYGPEGIGKSTLASQFPSPVFIDVEGSTEHMDVARTPRPKSWTAVREQLKSLRADPRGYKTIVIDTIDWAEDMLSEDLVASAASEKIRGIEDFGYGKGFTMLGERFGKFLNFLTEMQEEGWNVVLLAHTHIRKFEQPDEIGAYDRYEPKLTKKCYPLLKEWAHALLFCNFKTYAVEVEKGKKKGQGKQRVMYTTYHPCWDAKNRWELPDEVEMSFEPLAPYVNTAGPKGSSSQPQTTPATPAPADSHPDLEAQSGSYEKDEREAIDKPETTAPQPTGTKFPFTNPGGFPEKLMDLMHEAGVTEGQVRKVVAAKGYYPEQTPIHNYDDKFVDGVLVAAWPKVLEMIRQMAA